MHDEHPVEELERRIRTLLETHDHEFGHFTPVDWGICIFVGLIVPIALLLRFWP